MHPRRHRRGLLSPAPARLPRTLARASSSARRRLPLPSLACRERQALRSPSFATSRCDAAEHLPRDPCPHSTDLSSAATGRPLQGPRRPELPRLPGNAAACSARRAGHRAPAAENPCARYDLFLEALAGPRCVNTTRMTSAVRVDALARTICRRAPAMDPRLPHAPNPSEPLQPRCQHGLSRWCGGRRGCGRGGAGGGRGRGGGFLRGLAG
jgi:hypothetical protein